MGFGAQQIRIMLARLGGLACAGTGAATAKASSTLGVKARPSGLRRVNHFRATLLAAPHIWAAASALQTKQITTSTTTMSSQVGAECAAPSANLEVASWNIAAINNNPFEYWISYDNDDYNCLMADVQRFIKNPGEDDVAVSEIITDDKFADLKELMETYGWKDLDAVESRWREEYRDRKIVSEFLKDKEIGNKRLASMLDRVTNTINLADGSKAFRPTPINCYAEKFSSFDEWWSHWTNFMFKETIEVRMKGETKQVLPADLLLPIKRSKYPAISEEEEAISLPLQTVCAAAFDGILVHMLNKVSGEAWQDLRKQLSEALNMRKNERTMEILEKTYGSSDVVFLQEVAGAFVSQLEAHPVLSQRFAILAPVTSGKRDQLSVILANKEIFDIEAAKDVSDAVSAKFPAGKDVPVAEGDLVASLVPLRNSEEGTQPFLLASFHGDTNGLATIPVVQAVHDYVSEDLDNKATLLFGLDANTYENSTPGKTQDVLEFGEFYVKQGLTSTWGDKPKADEYTTFNARTFLQPQLNKAVTKEEVRAKGDVNPKDFILFYKNQMAAESSTVKDNTGERSFVEDVFPTLTFPSDHAVISAKVKTI